MVVEKLVEPIFGEQVKINLVIPAFRITYIHFPLILASFVIGYFTRSVGFIWLAVLVVGSEFLIVYQDLFFNMNKHFKVILFVFGMQPFIYLQAHMR